MRKKGIRLLMRFETGKHFSTVQRINMRIYHCGVCWRSMRAQAFLELPRNKMRLALNGYNFFDKLLLRLNPGHPQAIIKTWRHSFREYL